MKRGIDYEWSGTVELPERQVVCGFCGSDITTKTGYTGWLNFQGNKRRTDIYICHSCSLPNFFDIVDRQHPIFKTDGSNFSDTVKGISAKFVTIYSQAHQAEEFGLDEIAGLGYGKALEFLVKDYLIKNLPAEEDQIKELSLHACIHEKLDNLKIRTLADKARIIRNDETHYERKYEQSDTNDLKKLINATASWIDLETYTAEVAQTE